MKINQSSINERVDNIKIRKLQKLHKLNQKFTIKTSKPTTTKMSSQSTLSPFPKPLSNFKYNTVKILSIQQTDNKIRIIKMVRRKFPTKIPTDGGAINVDSDEENKENVIEIADSDDEEAARSEKLSQGSVKDAKTKEKAEKCHQEVLERAQNTRKGVETVQEAFKNDQKTQKQVKNPFKRSRTEQINKKTSETTPNHEKVPRNDQINKEITQIIEVDEETSNSPPEKPSNELKIIQATSLSESKDAVMQDLLIDFQNDEKTPQKSNFMETVELKAPHNDKNNNSPAKEEQKAKSGEFVPKLKCYKGCYSSKTHQKKHKFDISSPLGLLLSKRDIIDENYAKISLKRLEDNCKAPQVDNFEQWMHSTRSGKVTKTPRGRFGKPIQPSEVLAMMKDAGRERNFGKRKF